MILQEWSGYHTKAAYVLKCMANDCLGLHVWRYNEKATPVPRNGEWCRLGSAYNVGGKLLAWMVVNNLIERRGVTSGTSIEAFLGDWYRAAIDPADVDLGDWWIE